ncbi:MAG: undecaprenyl-phosphate alpha-N-acetylglucosaminyl 1-phosphate transferase, partial [Planctomycetota bacterium]
MTPLTPLMLAGVSPSRWYGALLMTFVSAALLALFLTPLLRHAAHRLGIVDVPDHGLKGHERPVAYMGGLALFLSFVGALAPAMQDLGKELEALLMGAGFLVLLGLLDDLHPLSPGVKFLGQLLPAGLVVKAGLLLELPLPDGTPGFVPVCITMLWVLGITNAFNIIDVMDGLSAGVGLIALTTLLMITLMNHTSPVTALATVSLAGALLG